MAIHIPLPYLQEFQAWFKWVLFDALLQVVVCVHLLLTNGSTSSLLCILSCSRTDRSRLLWCTVCRDCAFGSVAPTAYCLVESPCQTSYSALPLIHPPVNDQHRPGLYENRLLGLVASRSAALESVISTSQRPNGEECKCSFDASIESHHLLETPIKRCLILFQLITNAGPPVAVVDEQPSCHALPLD